MTYLMFLLRVLIFALVPVVVFGETGIRNAMVLLDDEVQCTDGLEDITIQFPFDNLRVIPAVSFETDTIGNTEPQHFKGGSTAVLMRQLSPLNGMARRYRHTITSNYRLSVRLKICSSLIKTCTFLT